MSTWLAYEQYRPGGQGVAGTVVVMPRLWSPQLGDHRDILVYLPPSYCRPGSRRYPSLYMHDGQNLFDPATSFAGEWQVDETLEALSGEGIETIAVGVPNGGEQRYAEYTPFPDETGDGGRGDAYLAFLVETVKPLVDAGFRTSLDRRQTGIAGSSLGGLISLYGFCRHRDVFGLAGIFSPALEPGRDATFAYVAGAPFAAGRIYMDVGTREAHGLEPDPEAPEEWSDRYRADVQQMRDVLLAKGYLAGQDLLYVEEEGAVHHESSWARRLPDALRFLLGR